MRGMLVDINPKQPFSHSQRGYVKDSDFQDTSLLDKGHWSGIAAVFSHVSAEEITHDVVAVNKVAEFYEYDHTYVISKCHTRLNLRIVAFLDIKLFLSLIDLTGKCRG
jgi:hypothetical protein